MSQSKIYVGNMSYDTTESDLRDAFGRFGSIGDSNVNVIMDRDTGRSKGFAFIEFDDQQAANAAIKEMNETDLAGRKIRVNLAKEDRGRTGGGPRTGGGRRFNRA